MTNYQNGTIYKIVCKDTSITDCYVGSTTNHNARKSLHKSTCNNEKDNNYNFPVYRFIRDNGGWKNWDFVLIEDYPCNKKKQLNIRERYWFEQFNSTLNSRYPERSKKEYREENKQEIAQKKKEYYQENREKNKQKIAQKNKEYREKNKQKYMCIACDKELTFVNKSRHEKTKKHILNVEKLNFINIK